MTADFYRGGLVDLLERGSVVPSVLGVKSKASNFGRDSPPWIELIGHETVFPNPRPFMFESPHLPVHEAYCFGLLAWTLAGRNDVETLGYYRSAAYDFSDDGLTMCGAFGARLFGVNHGQDQVAQILGRLKVDPASRRTYASIIEPEDNIHETLEFPCAAGVQFFLRDGQLHLLTHMRAEQALTVLPYDVFLFSTLHHFWASQLSVETGTYRHHSGTFHIYENEVELSRRVVEDPISVKWLPEIPKGRAFEVAAELEQIELSVRAAVGAGDRQLLAEIGSATAQSDFNSVAKEALVKFAESKIGGSNA